MDHIFEFFRSLGFGGLLGAGVFGSAHLLFPGLFPGAIDLNDILIVGGLSGAGFHKLLDSILNQFLLNPIGGFIQFYSKLVQLVLIRNVIGQKMYNETVHQLTKRYFIENDRSERTKKLPPF